MGISIRDVAAAAGVSTATVSRALRGLSNVDEKTRQHVEKVASDLNYVVSPSASRLASGKTGSIAVVTPHIARWFFSTALSGVEHVLQKADLDLLLMCIGDFSVPSQRSPVAPRLRRRVDGILVLAVQPADPQVADILALKMPTATVGLTLTNVPSVAIDDLAAAQLATQHLINLGHTSIGIIAGSTRRELFDAEARRMEGFNQSITEAGLTTHESWKAYGEFTMDGGESAMTQLLAQPNPPTAIFAMSDEMAFGALRSIRGHGLQPGVDVSIVGIDGHDVCEQLDLTTVVQPVVELGRLGAEVLLTHMRDPDAPIEPIRVDTQLVVRGSTGPARA